MDLRWAKNLRKLAPYKALLDFAFVVRSQMLYAAELRARKVQRYDTAIIMPQFPVSEMELFQGLNCTPGLSRRSFETSSALGGAKARFPRDSHSESDLSGPPTPQGSYLSRQIRLSR